MKLTLDRVIGILGIAVGIPAILELFHSSRIREGLLLSALIILLFAAFIYIRWEERQPLFSYEEIRKELVFADPAADLATLTTHARIKAHHPVQQIWFRNINADGEIKKFDIDGTAPAQIQRKAGSWEVCKQFDHVLRRGDVTGVTLKYELHKSFCNPTEGMTQVTSTPTRRLILRVEFHSQRKGQSLRAFVGKGAQVEEPLEAPKALEAGRIVETLIEKPKKGAYYTLEWTW